MCKWWVYASEMDKCCRSLFIGLPTKPLEGDGLVFGPPVSGTQAEAAE